MKSRERVNTTLNHSQPDRTPLDLGASAVSGMHVSCVYALRQAYGLDEPGTPVKVVEPYQMLGEIAPDLMDMLGIDTIGVGSPRTMFGFKNEGWKSWDMSDGTPVLVPECFNTSVEPNGDIFMYPEGDKTVAPSGRMPAGGWFFDSIVRQDPIDEDSLNPEDNLEEFTPLNSETLEYVKTEVERLYTQTDKAILASFGGTAFGDIALIPAPWMRKTRGIRDITEWYMSTIIRRDYIYDVFEKQCEIALKNLEKIHDSVGDKVTAVFITGTDFGTQNGLFISKESYRDLYKPFHLEVNNWVHKNTKWKTFLHSCGGVFELIDDFIDAGFDIMNPVQCSAAQMDPKELKNKFGERITFWGGGIDTQKILPFGTPLEVREQVKERMDVFGHGGGFVFNTIHNVQAKTPVDNLVALYQAVQDYR
jgi:uroporphyrinogen-III decarboxylase